MKKQPKKTTQTKAALTMAFWELYKTKPITKITVKDVTDGAGFFRSTFYLYFTDVYSVLEQIETKILLEWESDISEIFEQGKRDSMLDMITAFYEHNGEYMSVLLSPSGDPTFQQKIKDIMRPKMFSLLKLSEENVESTLIFEFIISAMLAYLTEWYRNAKHMTAKEAVALLQSIVSTNIVSVMFRNFGTQL